MRSASWGVCCMSASIRQMLLPRAACMPAYNADSFPKLREKSMACTACFPRADSTTRRKSCAVPSWLPSFTNTISMDTPACSKHSVAVL